MKLIAEKLAANAKAERLRFVRGDGSQTQADMPRQGILPHDLVHYVVESALPLRHGFLGQIAAGAEAGFVMQSVHDRGNVAVATEAVQIEAIVEALQTQLWAGSFEAEAFAEGVRSACAARGKEIPDLSDIVAKSVLYDGACELLERWKGVPPHQRMELDFVAGVPAMSP